MDKKKGKRKRIMLRRSICMLLAFIMVFSTLPISSLSVSASENQVEGEVSASYQEATWNNSEVTYTNKTAESCTLVADGTTEWNAGWYVVNGTITIDRPITVNGNVSLILSDGCTLNANSGIVVPKTASLTIYAQSGDSGTLVAKGFTDDNSNAASAGIGGSTTDFDSGEIVIHGGNINATGGGKPGYFGGAGIGGGTNTSGNGGSSSTITIYGGNITASSGEGNITGAGIGGGGGTTLGGFGSNILICGGNISATSAGIGADIGGAGIGGGGSERGNGGDGSGITINDGKVTAMGGDCAAGIGGGGSSSGFTGTSGNGLNINITGGEVTAVGSQYAAGIGGGGGYHYNLTDYNISGDLYGGQGRDISITGGIVYASSPTTVTWEGYEGNPIGNGGNTTKEAGVTKTAGIIFENTVGTVYGDVTLTEPFTVPDGHSLTFATGASVIGKLNVPDAAAMAERDGKVIGCFGISDFEGADNLFSQDTYANATITLLKDVQPDTNSDTNVTCSTMVNITCTLDLDGHNFTSTDVAIYVLPMGNLTIQNSSTDKTGQVISNNAAAVISENTITLKGGTYAGTPAIKVNSGNLSDFGILPTDGDTHYAFFDASGNAIPLTEWQDKMELTGPVTVQECKHEDVKPTSNNDATHALNCPYCGYTGAAEDCTYGNYQHDADGHWQACTKCSYEKKEAHNLLPAVTASGNIVTLSEGCDTEGCGYELPIGTVDFTFPKMTYGQTDQTVTWKTDIIPSEYIMIMQVDGADQRQTDDGLTSMTLAELFNKKGMTVGEHKMGVCFISCKTGKTTDPCILTLHVDKTPMTDGMVLPDKTEVIYNGQAQKPDITVRQGETTLTVGTDYDVSYTRDDAVTTDFTNAGTISITITGKGNYQGEVKKTFTIKQAEPDVGTVTAGTLMNTLDVSQVALSRTNQTHAGTLTLTDNTLRYGTNTYTWKFTPEDTVNYKTVTGKVEITVNDTIAPTAEYQLGTDGWKKFINTVSLGLFCKDYITVTIRGTDDTDTVTGSGIRLIQYYISDKEITDPDSIMWNSYTEPVIQDAQGTYLIYVKVTDNAGNTAVLNSEGIVIYAESTVSPAAFDYTYKESRDCTIQLTMNGNTFKELTDSEGNAIDTNNYTIDSNGTLILKAAYLDTLDKGGYTYKVSVNPQGIETEQVTPVYAFTVNVEAKELTVTGAAATDRAYDGTNAVKVTAVTLSGAAPDDEVAVDLSNIQGMLGSANAGTYAAVTLPELTLTGADKENYRLIQPVGTVAASVTIAPLAAGITVGTDTYNKTFGDAAFTLDVTDNNTEADAQYEVTKGTDVVSVENGTVTIQNAGTAEIKVFLPASTNYTAAADKYIRITVKKKSGYTVDALNRSYYYKNGGTDSIDLAALLPADCGNVTYNKPITSGNVEYSVAPDMSGGKLSYTLSGGNADSAGTITVTAVTKNHEDITITVNVKLTDQIPVSLKTGTEVTLKNNALTYGEPLSNLVFNEAEFVGNDKKTVTGTLAWQEAAATPNAGTASAVWIFTPAEDKYASLEGTVPIMVTKAKPTVSAEPTLEGRVYNPSVTLKGYDLSGVTVTGAGGNALKGVWKWQSEDIVPTVNNSGYVAVFTPKDTTNYETITRTITVNVTKATPYIAKPPVAAGITYGKTLNDSALSGGTVLYGNGKGQAGDGEGNTTKVAGTFTWKEPSTKPTAADSNVTAYAVVFTPSDTANYHSIEVKVKLTVSKTEDVAKNSAKLDSGISVKWNGNALTLKWAKISRAKGYDVFAAQSGKKLNKKSLVKTVKNGKTSVSITKIAGKKISSKKAYSVKIKAWKYVNGKKVYTGESRAYHIAGKENKKYTNVKKLEPHKKKYILKKGKSICIQIKITKQSKKKKLLPKSYGPALQYWSDNKKIATVTSKGKVTAKKKGTCYIYVTALNGVKTKIKITVK